MTQSADTETTQEEIGIDGFALSKAEFFRLMLVKEAMLPLALCLVALSVGILVAIFYRWEFLVASLMIIFLIVPAVITHQYFSTALKSITSVNTVPHLYYITENGMEVEIMETSRKIFITFEDMDAPQLYSGSLIIPMKKRSEGWLWMPREAFDSDEAYSDFFKNFESEDRK